MEELSLSGRSGVVATNVNQQIALTLTGGDPKQMFSRELEVRGNLSTR